MPSMLARRLCSSWARKCKSQEHFVGETVDVGSWFDMLAWDVEDTGVAVFK